MQHCRLLHHVMRFLISPSIDKDKRRLVHRSSSIYPSALVESGAKHIAVGLLILLRDPFRGKMRQYFRAQRFG